MSQRPRGLASAINRKSSSVSCTAGALLASAKSPSSRPRESAGAKVTKTSHLSCRRQAGHDTRGHPSEWPLVTVARGGVEPPTFRFSVGRSYQLSYLASPCGRDITGADHG